MYFASSVFILTLTSVQGTTSSLGLLQETYTAAVAKMQKMSNFEKDLQNIAQMKLFVANILFLLLMAAPFASSAQYQYLLDTKSDKHKHSIKSDIEMMKLNVDEYKKMKQEAKEDRKASRQTISHTYKIQTRKTRRRMMASRCEAAKFNGDHHFWCEPLHMLWRHGDFMPYIFAHNRSKCKMSVKK